ncbi:MAG: hypothetical protein FWJ65_06735 [Limnochordales bacterium]
MSKLQEFLNSHPIKGLTAEVAVSDRFKDEKGNVLKFKISAMTNPQWEHYRREAMTIKTKQGTLDLNLDKLNKLIVINHTIDPNFKDAASIQALGCQTPEEYLDAVLLPGELAQLSQEIQRLSGFKPMDELVEEAKN